MEHGVSDVRRCVCVRAATVRERLFVQTTPGEIGERRRGLLRWAWRAPCCSATAPSRSRLVRQRRARVRERMFVRTTPGDRCAGSGCDMASLMFANAFVLRAATVRERLFVRTTPGEVGERGRGLLRWAWRAPCCSATAPSRSRLVRQRRARVRERVLVQTPLGDLGQRFGEGVGAVEAFGAG